ncbi:MAG: glycosyl transferase [Planctomycetota bacterium]|nr:MAG: glycosyl transferase [Planctomycetota bacterium]
MSSATPLAVVVPDLSVGGLQGMAVDLIAALDPDEFAPHVYSFDAGGPLEERLAELEVPHVHMPRAHGVAPGYARELGERFSADGIQLVHCHNVTALFHGARAAWRAGRVPVLFTEHDREMPAPWKHRILHRWLARRVTRTVAVSAGLARDLTRFEGFPAARTSSRVNGIPDPQLRALPDRAAARAELGWDERPVILAVGNLTPVKNHLGFLKVFDRVAQALNGEVRFVLAGSGPLHDGIRAAADALPAGDVELLGRRDDVARLLAAANVFVLPSHREGLPLSLVEAHAMERPSVCWDVGGNGEVTVANSTGFLIDYGDEEAYAARLLELLRDADLATRMGAAARERFTEHFTHAAMVADYVEHYRQLLGARV